MRRVLTASLAMLASSCGGCGGPDPLAAQAESEAELGSLRTCNDLHLQGDAEGARRCYDEVAPLLSDRERAAEASYHAAERETGRARIAALEAVLVSYGDTRTARRGLALLRAGYRSASDCEAEPRALGELAERVRAGASGEPGQRPTLVAELEVTRARLVLEGCGDVARALSLLQAAEPATRTTVWLDDLVFLAGQALAKLGQHSEALARFREIIDSTQTAWFFGSYDSLYLDDAYLAAGGELEALGRTGEARSVYRELIHERPASRLVDDAAFRVAVLAAGEGDVAALEEFVSKYPDSRHVRAARDMLGHARGP